MVVAEIQLTELEDKKMAVEKEKNALEVEEIEQKRKLKQIELELETQDCEIDEQNKAIEKTVEFNEKLLRQLELFEQENREIIKMFGNLDEIQDAVVHFEEIIVSSREFLLNI